jgi:hypothetical protein
MQAACKVTGIKHTPSTAYHLRTDGQLERSNQWLETAIRFITDEKQKNWALYLPIAQFAHNMSRICKDPPRNARKPTRFGT